MSSLIVNLQRLLPHHLLSRVVGYLANSQLSIIKSTFIRVFCFFYGVNLDEAERSSIDSYKTFNDFFTRSLKPGLRPVAGTICSPADGTVAAFGRIHDGLMIQSKGHEYSLATLLAEQPSEDFLGGSFITIYLAPHNYHRVHVPCMGELSRATYIPGRLFSVNERTTRHLPGLFTKNERLVCRFTDKSDAMFLVMVGAMLVAGIRPVWLDHPYQPRLHIESEMKQQFEQGDELGQFEMGSTVILVFDRPVEFQVKEGQPILYGEQIA